MIDLRNGDCLQLLTTLQDNSVDAIVTDPPYGISFMAKGWDADVPPVVVWKECLRVLKPGGYLLAFAGTRTQHRMATYIEDAGFNIKDMIGWIFGQGFPKGLDIGKAVDKLQGNEREVVGEKVRGDVQKAKLTGSTFAVADANKNNKDIFGYGIETLTKGTSEWEGWKTCLKPAFEPVTVAQKPISEKTIALNVLKWGTGGINIDACRVEVRKDEDSALTRRNKSTPDGYTFDTSKHDTSRCNFTSGSKVRNFKESLEESIAKGRYPANIIHDGSEEVENIFPQTASNSRKRKTIKGKQSNSEFLGTLTGTGQGFQISDSGSASRFFYCAKASKSERNEGCEGLESKQGIRTNAPRENEDIKTPLRKNNHPTVKPIKLMEYLIKLVSKEGAVILEPFLGSGTTGVAAVNLQRDFIGFELDADYFEIAQKRIEFAVQKNKEKLF